MRSLHIHAIGALVVIGCSFQSLNAQELGEAGTEAHMKGHSYEMDPAHSQVTFKIRHMAVANVRGRFHDVNASIFLDPTDITTLSAEAVISVASVDTENERRDNDLRSDNFFDVATFPEMKFAGAGVSDVGGDGTFKLHGQLTIRDVTKDVVLEAEMSGPIVSGGQERIGFVATTRIDRFEYGLKWDALTEAGGLVAGRDVDITVEIEARRPVE
jgi:polyisoprenoid-binding protein YceI